MSDPCTDASIAQNAKSVGVDVCVIKGFCAQYGRLPGSAGKDGIKELDDWGDANGFHHADGTWTCPTGVHPPTGGNAGGGTTDGGTGTGTGITNPDPFASLFASIQANPMPFVLIAGVGYLLGRK